MVLAAFVSLVSLVAVESVVIRPSNNVADWVAPALEATGALLAGVTELPIILLVVPYAPPLTIDCNALAIFRVPPTTTQFPAEQELLVPAITAESATLTVCAVPPNIADLSLVTEKLVVAMATELEPLIGLAPLDEAILADAVPDTVALLLAKAAALVPLAVLVVPPITAALLPLAVFELPPATKPFANDAVLKFPAMTPQAEPDAVFPKPPPTKPQYAEAALLSPKVVAPCAFETAADSLRAIHPVG